MTANELRQKELKYVETPLMKQLAVLGWDTICLDESTRNDPAVSYRKNLEDAVIERELTAAILRINPWVTESQANDIVIQMCTYSYPGKLLENNIEVFDRIAGTGLSCDDEKTGEPNRPVRVIDYSDIEEFDKASTKNHYLAISQYKVRIPGKEEHIIPDVTLFVNGLPLVVIECKAPDIEDPMYEGIEQLMRYQNRRDSREPEGVPELFYFNQFMISTCYHMARYSTITGKASHYIEWKDPYPLGLSDIKPCGAVSSQEILVAGMLSPAHLLDIVQNFTVHIEDDENCIIKVVARYLQFRGACKIIERLRSGETPEERGGTIWHTQGSGKTLTMMFVIRKMYHSTDLQDYKIVMLLDRKDLQTQLFKKSQAVPYVCNVAGSIEGMKDLIRNTSSDISIGMVHKFGEQQKAENRRVKGKKRKPVENVNFPVLNESPKILLMIDEAHRSEYSDLAANMWHSMPKSTKIAFTGTPIAATTETFGGYIDTYTMRQAVEDEVVVEIKYEGHAVESTVTDTDAMNRKFLDVFGMIDSDEQQKIMGRYTKRGYLEDKDIIRAKAMDMLDHYIGTVFSNGFKAQVVATSREAAYRYKSAFEELLPQKIAMLHDSNPLGIDINQLERLKVACIISAQNNDDPYLKELANDSTNENIIKGFKESFKENVEGVDSSYGILVVASMLLTGFDAPVEQVMYLDKEMRDHTLLQAIARVNRTSGADKKCGYVVDYVGITRHLKEALAAYTKADIDETLSVLRDKSQDIDSLNSSYHVILRFLEDKLGILSLEETEKIIEELVADNRLREDFNAKFKFLTKYYDRVLPDPAAHKYTGTYKLLSFIRQSVANRCRDSRFSMRDASKKVRAIIEEFLSVNGVDIKIAPLSILDEDFIGKIKGKSMRAKCDELTYGIREFININMPKDPEFYERLSEKLERVLKSFKDNWDELYGELQKIRQEGIVEGRNREETYGYDAIKEMPFLALIKSEVYGRKNYSELSESEFNTLREATNDVLEIIRRETGTVNFWDRGSAQDVLRTHIINNILLTSFPSAFEKRKEIAQKIMELAFQHYGREN